MHLLFDLDGTLTDSREGIVRCIQHALLELGAFSPPFDALTAYVGPPLPASFATLLGTSDSERIDRALAVYRRRFVDIGMFESALYPGIDDALASLSSDGFRLVLVTSKPRVYARQILEHFDLARRFCGVYGPELSDRQYSKASLIRQACAEHDIVPPDALMIGDRADHILGARENRLRAIAVLWGYANREELEKARPAWLASSGEELVECVRRAAQELTST